MANFENTTDPKTQKNIDTDLDALSDVKKHKDELEGQLDNIILEQSDTESLELQHHIKQMVESPMGSLPKKIIEDETKISEIKNDLDNLKNKIK